MILPCDSLTSVHFRFPGGRKALTAAKRDCRKPGSRFTSLATMLPQTFWDKVHKTETCWNWTGAKLPMGYGKFAIKRRPKLTHRLVWMDTFGEIPPKLLVLHHCDNTSCVNPSHLFLGTNKDNMVDCARKGRINTQKTSKELAMLIFNYPAGLTATRKHFGVSEAIVANIKSKRSFAWMHTTQNHLTKER